MRIPGFGGGEVFAMLFLLVFQVAMAAVIALALYWVIRKAVCAGMRDFENERSDRPGR